MLLTVAAIRWEISIRQTMVNETAGIVMRVGWRFSRSSPFRVYVAYTLNGERYLSRLRSDNAFIPFGLREGQQIRIFYDPADRNRIRSDSGIITPLLHGTLNLFVFLLSVMGVLGKLDKSHPDYPAGAEYEFIPPKPTMGEIAERIKNISKEEAEEEKKIIMEMIAELERENSAMGFRRWFFPSLARQNREDIEELTEYVEILSKSIGEHLELKKSNETASWKRIGNMTKAEIKAELDKRKAVPWERIENMSQEEIMAKLKEMAERRKRDK